MSDASVTSLAPTATYTECWVFSTNSDGYVQSTPAYPIATGAECFVIFPTGGGIEKSPIPNSQAWPMNTEPAYSSLVTASSQTSIIGPVVGTILAFLFMISLITWLLLVRRARRRQALIDKRHWALKPGKWITNEVKPADATSYEGFGGVKHERVGGNSV